MIKYFNKPLEKVTIEELRTYLYEYLLNERKLSDKTVNHYNSVTRTKIYKKREVPTLKLLEKVLGKDFNLCPNCKRGHMLIPNTT